MAESGGNPELTIRVVGDWSSFDSELDQRARQADQGVTFGAPGRGLPDPGRVQRFMLEDQRANTDRDQVDRISGEMTVRRPNYDPGRSLARQTGLARRGGGHSGYDQDIDAEWEPVGGPGRGLPPPLAGGGSWGGMAGGRGGAGGALPGGAGGGGGAGGLPPPWMVGAAGQGGGGGGGGFTGANFYQGWSSPLPSRGLSRWDRANAFVNQLSNGTMMSLMFGGWEVAKAASAARESDTDAALSDTAVGALVARDQGIQQMASGVFGAPIGTALDIMGVGPAQVHEQTKMAQVREKGIKQTRDEMRRATDIRTSSEGMTGGRFGTSKANIEREFENEKNLEKDVRETAKEGIENARQKMGEESPSMFDSAGDLRKRIGDWQNVISVKNQAMLAARDRLKAAEERRDTQRTVLNREIVGEAQTMGISQRAAAEEAAGLDPAQAEVNEMRSRNRETERRAQEENNPNLSTMKYMHESQEKVSQMRVDRARSIGTIITTGELEAARYAGGQQHYEAAYAAQRASGAAALASIPTGDKQRIQQQTEVNAQLLQNITGQFTRGMQTDLNSLNTATGIEQVKGETDRKVIQHARGGFNLQANLARITGEATIAGDQAFLDYQNALINTPKGAAGDPVRQAHARLFSTRNAEIQANKQAQEEAAIQADTESRGAVMAGLRAEKETSGLHAEGKHKSAAAVEIQRSAENANLNIKGPDASAIKRLNLGIAINREKELEREMTWEGLKGSSRGVSMGADVGLGMEGTRPDQEELPEALAANKKAIEELTKALDKLNAEAGDGGTF